jgi:membrane protein DedA with SNARE-associated domain
VDIAALIDTYRYPLVVLGAIAEGEVIVVTAGYLAHRHHMDVGLVAVCAMFGGSVGDLGYFLIGRRYGERALLRLPGSIRAGADRARAAVEHNPVRVLLVMRFLYGMRIALPVLCGASTMKLWRFARYGVGTAVVWSLLFTGVGYAFGAMATAAIREIERYEWLVLCAIVALGFALHRASKPLQRWVQARTIGASDNHGRG